ncbi:MAG: spermidine/putrescine ABC transporter substrate-binding protein [Bdellovibrionia bacterium]
MRLSILRAGSLVALSAFALIATHCTQKNTTDPAGTQSAPAVRVVNLAIWSNYLSPDLFASFEKKTGIKIQISNYSSNEELLAKLQAGASGYDVAVPSDYMIFVMRKLALLQELDFSQLPNSKALDSKFLKKPYDPENTYSVPYNWGTTGIAINRALYSGSVKGWKDLFEKPDLAGKLSLLDDAREVLGAALKAQGYSLNSKNPEELTKAKELLLKTRSRIKAFTSEPKMPLINGEIAVAHVYMSDALQARRTTGGKIDYLVPEEGSTLWIDNLVIPKGARNIKEAHEFINFLIDAKANVSTVTNILVAPANKLAFALLPKELQNDTMLFPSPASLAKCEMIEDLGESLALWDRIWTEVKARRD